MTHVQKETAILLKEKGFNIPCLAWYIVEDEIMRSTTDYEEDTNGKFPRAFTAPELYKVPIWLRETKGVCVVALPAINTKFWVGAIFIQKINGYWYQAWSVGIFDTHDLALEAGIVHALKNYVK